MIAESTAKTTNLEKTIYFLSLMSFSIKSLASYSHVKVLCFLILRGKKKFCARKWLGEGRGGGGGTNRFWLEEIIQVCEKPMF